MKTRATAQPDGAQRKCRDALREPQRRGPGRPAGPRAFGVGPVLTRQTKALLDGRYDGRARTLVYYLLDQTGDELPGFARLRMVDVIGNAAVQRSQVYRHLATISGDVRTRTAHGLLHVWSPLAAHAMRKTGRWAEWWATLRGLEKYYPKTPFLREVRAWLSRAKRAGFRPELEDAECPAPWHNVIKLFHDVRPHVDVPMAGGMSARGAARTADNFVRPTSLQIQQVAPIVFTSGNSSGKPDGLVRHSPQQFHALTPIADRPLLKRGREIQDHDLTSPVASLGLENLHPPLSLDPRATRTGAESGAFAPPAPLEGGGDGFRGERETAVRALSDTVTADHVPGGNRVPPPSSETRLRAARAEEEDDVTREEQLEALRAIEAGEKELPTAPTRPAPSPEGRPVRLGEVAPSGPPPVRARPRAKGGTVTPAILRAALLAAMARHLPGWTFRGGPKNDEAIFELGRRYCANRTVEWLGYWLEEQVARFARDERADGHQPTGLVLFLRAKGVSEPYIPEPAGKFAPLGSGAPPPVEELFAALDKASAEMWTPRKVSEG